MSDFNVQIKVRNGRLLRRIREDYGTAAEFCRRCDLSAVRVSALVTMREAPILKSGEWSEFALNVAGALGAYPDEIWPEHMRSLKAKRATAEIELDAEDVAALGSGSFEQRQLIARWAKFLTPREAICLTARMCGATLDEAAAEINASRARTHQIEARAVRKMRDAARRDGIKEYRQVAE